MGNSVVTPEGLSSSKQKSLTTEEVSIQSTVMKQRLEWIRYAEALDKELENIKDNSNISDEDYHKVMNLDLDNQEKLDLLTVMTKEKLTYDEYLHRKEEAISRYEESRSRLVEDTTDNDRANGIRSYVNPDYLPK